MEREPLDSIEYESTYLELRPARRPLTGTTHAPILARRVATVQVDDDAVASIRRPAATAEIITALSDTRTAPTTRLDFALGTLGRSGAEAIRPAGAPPNRPLRVTPGQRPGVTAGHLISRHRPASRILANSSLLVVVSASLAIVALVDQRAARDVFLGLTGVLVLGWARLAWSARPRAGPFGIAVTRGIDRVVTAVGTFFAVALWARYAPDASAAFSRPIVVVLCGAALVGGLFAAARALQS